LDIVMAAVCLLAGAPGRGQSAHPLPAGWFRPDLRITSVAHSPRSAYAILVTIKNQGNVAIYGFPVASSSPILQVIHHDGNGQALGSDLVSVTFPAPFFALNPGKEVTVIAVLPGPVLPGTVVDLFVDVAQKFAELDESNNSFEWLVT
jgi:hypothetical protein